MREGTAWAFETINNVLQISFIEGEDGDRHEYTIGPVHMLTGHLVEDEELSRIIFHISDKSWASLDMLYAIAAKITSYKMPSTINWIKTFTGIELSRDGKAYIDEQMESEPPIEGDLEIPGYKSARQMSKETFAYIRHMQSIGDDERQRKADEVSVRLRLEGII